MIALPFALPSVAALKAIGAAVIVLGSGLAGWTARGWKADADAFDAERKAHQTYAETVEGWAAAMNEISIQRGTDQQHAADERRDFERKVRDARKHTQPLVVCGPGQAPAGSLGAGNTVRFSADFVRLWNDANRIGLSAALRSDGGHGASSTAGQP